MTRADFWSQRRALHPTLREALTEDAKLTARHRGERHEFRSKLDAAIQIARLACVSDGFLAMAFYRGKARLQALRVPVLPRILHRLAMATAGVAIGDPVVVHAGVYVVHGYTVVDGITEIHAGAIIAPYTTIGLVAGDLRGPTLERDVRVGTGARVLGSLTVGAGAAIGANAVVLRDVPAGATVVGAPARPVTPREVP